MNEGVNERNLCVNKIMGKKSEWAINKETEETIQLIYILEVNAYHHFDTWWFCDILTLGIVLRVAFVALKCDAC